MSHIERHSVDASHIEHHSVDSVDASHIGLRSVDASHIDFHLNLDRSKLCHWLKQHRFHVLSTMDDEISIRCSIALIIDLLHN